MDTLMLMVILLVMISATAFALPSFLKILRDPREEISLIDSRELAEQESSRSH